MSIAPTRGAGGGGGIGGNNSCLGMQANYHVPKGKEATASDRWRGKKSNFEGFQGQIRGKIGRFSGNFQPHLSYQL